jgi:hypothetical protein
LAQLDREGASPSMDDLVAAAPAEQLPALLAEVAADAHGSPVARHRAIFALARFRSPAGDQVLRELVAGEAPAHTRQLAARALSAMASGAAAAAP